MLPAVELDHEPQFKATKVCNVSPDSILPSEFCTKLPAAQSHPELQLRPGLIAPQLPRGRVKETASWDGSILLAGCRDAAGKNF
jgi:hypothetical protein